MVSSISISSLKKNGHILYSDKINNKTYYVRETNKSKQKYLFYSVRGLPGSHNSKLKLETKSSMAEILYIQKIKRLYNFNIIVIKKDNEFFLEFTKS